MIKAIINKPFFRKYGKKSLALYIAWCFVKSLLFLLAGWLFS
jgi:hypothetical protein